MAYTEGCSAVSHSSHGDLDTGLRRSKRAGLLSQGGIMIGLRRVGYMHPFPYGR